MVIAKQLTATVATAGTRVPVLAAGVAIGNVVGVRVQCSTGTVYLGDSTVSSTSYGLKLASTDTSVELPLGNQALDLATLYIDGAANGATLQVLYFVKVSH